MMKRIFALGLLLSLSAVFTFADDKPKHNTLTPKEVADGWILLFDGESTFGWQSPNDSKWTIADGMLAPQADKPGLLVSTTAFADYELQFDFLRHKVPQSPDDKARANIQIRVTCDQEGKPRENGSDYSLPFTGNTFSTTTVTVKDGKMVSTHDSASGWIYFYNDKKGDGTSVKPVKQSGFITLSGNGVVFRDIKLKPTGTKPLFNGKDLTGWGEFPGGKSKFTIGKEGTIDLKDGPGDLQTVDQYQDFIFQAECLSHGKHLNSGIFFRCIPNEYQNGYEAQIHNGWTEKPEKEYTVEEYDPKTNELKDKERIRSAAMDYGTGGIYNRVPARKAVAKDNEWFTITVAAQGRHIATWVNGIQVVDWTDNRPVKDNAPNGCKLEKGAISLEGHDPTTDLSFRNIRIADLSTEKKWHDQETASC